MNVLEQIRQRHHLIPPNLCSCGDALADCDAAQAAAVGLELLDAVTLSMSHLLTVTKRNERALLLAEDQAERFGSY
jgi:hypothetical protein